MQADQEKAVREIEASAGKSLEKAFIPAREGV
jgi:hypothetical protein